MAELLVDTGAVCRNYAHFAAMGTAIPVLKENAYGMGAQAILDLLREKAGVSLFACSRTEEALNLNRGGADMLLLGCEHDADALEELVRGGVIVAVESLEQARKIDGLGIPARVQLAVDTGMGRFGFLPEETERMRAVFALENLTVFGIFSHFADEGRSAQTRRFREVLSALEGYPVGLRHIAATYGAEDPDCRFDAVRVGSGLTGRASYLETATTLCARICTVRRLKKGSSVSYAGVKLRRDTDVAVIDLGTGDGAFTYRSCGPRTWLEARRRTVNVGGRQAPLIGFPGLTHTIIDVTGIACGAGDRVTVDASPVMVDASVPRRYVGVY